MKYIKEFADNAAYTAYTSSADFVTPNVSYIIADNAVEMTPYVPPVIEPKWIATYSDSHTESASCDSTSVISQNEITLADLVSVEIGDCVTSIGNNVFRSCSSLTSIDIPNSVTSIAELAFSYCESLTSIDIPSGVTYIGEAAFWGCTGLTSIRVDALTPPELGSMALNNTNNAPIYVPVQSLSAYQSASGWSDFAYSIQPIPNS